MLYSEVSRIDQELTNLLLPFLLTLSHKDSSTAKPSLWNSGGTVWAQECLVAKEVCGQGWATPLVYQLPWFPLHSSVVVTAS